MADAEKKKKVILNLRNVFRHPLKVFGRVADEHGGELVEGLVVAFMGGATLSLKTAGDVVKAIAQKAAHDELVEDALKTMPATYSVNERSAFEAGANAMYDATKSKLGG